MNEWIQSSVVILLVLWSVWLSGRRYFPQAIYRCQQAIARYLRQHQYVMLANYILPSAPQKTGCDSGCGGCSQACPSTQTSTQPVKFIHKATP
ncbi:DUF6587 family protein [Agitococcus lubricus]|uniref:Uncharacterized protein n=1 Tax=Agitococcus lubricus TaxID=1077255 RepID=A0A2T5IUH2_9GAMM|nr:DUF6587 family protein [Agitococcus lubricus]PTQ87545.1 hypothetical protein C8N29_11840 [Agitococcus lubricus]